MTIVPTASIELSDLAIAYNGRLAIHRLTGAFKAGSLTALVGPNGAGKTTLLKAIGGILQPSGGCIERGPLTPDRIAYLPQHAHFQPDFPISVMDLVQIGHWCRTGWARAIDRTLRRRAVSALETVGLHGFDRRPIGSLSAGQLQRALFARVIVQDAALILLDEPFSAIDAGTTRDLLALIGRWHGEHRTVVAALHDLDQVRRHFPETLLLAREGIGWGATTHVLTPANLERAWQRTVGSRPHGDHGYLAAS